MAVRVLQARFHADQTGSAGFVIVGHLVWPDGIGRRARPIFYPSAAVKTKALPPAMLSKLEYLIGATAPESFERLQALRSRFWSFVEITADPR